MDVTWQHVLSNGDLRNWTVNLLEFSNRYHHWLRDSGRLLCDHHVHDRQGQTCCDCYEPLHTMELTRTFEQARWDADRGRFKGRLADPAKQRKTVLKLEGHPLREVRHEVFVARGSNVHAVGPAYGNVTFRAPIPWKEVLDEGQQVTVYDVENHEFGEVIRCRYLLSRNPNFELPTHDFLQEGGTLWLDANSGQVMGIKALKTICKEPKKVMHEFILDETMLDEAYWSMSVWPHIPLAGQKDYGVGDQFIVKEDATSAGAADLVTLYANLLGTYIACRRMDRANPSPNSGRDDRVAGVGRVVEGLRDLELKGEERRIRDLCVGLYEKFA